VGRVEVYAPDDSLALQCPVPASEDVILEVALHPIILSGAIEGLGPVKGDLRVRIELRGHDTLNAERELLTTVSEGGRFSVATRVPLDQVRTPVSLRVVSENVHLQRRVDLEDLLQGRVRIRSDGATLRLRAMEGGDLVRPTRFAFALNSQEGRSYHTVRDSNPDGSITLQTDSGRMQVWLVAEGHPLQQTIIDIPIGESVVRDLSFTDATGFVQGVVVDESGGPRPGVMVFCLPVPKHGVPFSAFLSEPYVSGSDGHFTIPLSGLPTDMQVFAQRGTAISQVARFTGEAQFELPLIEKPSRVRFHFSGLAMAQLSWAGCTLAVVGAERVASWMDWGDIKFDIPINMPVELVEQVYFAGPAERVIAKGRVLERKDGICSVFFALEPSDEIVFLIENSAGKAVPAMRVELAWREQSSLPWEVAQSDVSGQGRIRFRSLGRELMGLRVGIGLSAELVPVSIEEVIASEGELKVVVQ
jgi:hypothetical protein